MISAPPPYSNKSGFFTRLFSSKWKQTFIKTYLINFKISKLIKTLINFTELHAKDLHVLPQNDMQLAPMPAYQG
jgi:hypothetical protein